MFASYEYSSVVGWCLKHMIIESWLVDVLKYMITDSWLVGVWNIQLFNHGWCCLCCGSTVCISGINYHELFSPSIMEYRVFEFGVYDIWLWSSYCIALHCTCHLELCHEPMVATIPVQHRLLGITM